MNCRGTIGFDTLPHIFIGYKLATVSNNVQEQERDFTLKMGEYVVYPAYFPDKSQNCPNLWQSNHVENESFSPPKLGFVPYGFFGARGQCSSKIPCREACCSGVCCGNLWVWVKHVVHSETSTGEITFSTTECETRNKSVKFLARSEYGCLKLG